MKTQRNLIILATALLFIACNKSNTVVNEKIYNYERQNWKSNQITQFVGDISYTATEVPLKYYILKNSVKNKNSNVDSIAASNNHERIIEFEFQHIDKVDLLEKKYTDKDYETSVKYLAFNIEKDFSIVTSSNDTIECSGALFERNFKVAPFKRALLYFNNIDPEDNIQLIYNDQLFGNGHLTFNFNDRTLKL